MKSEPPLFARSTSNFQTCLESAAAAKAVMSFARAETIFAQGDTCEHVLYIQTGCVKLSVRSSAGREAIVAMLGPGEFFGEGCLAGQTVRVGNATAATSTLILVLDKRKMTRLLHEQQMMSDRFISQVLTRNVRIEEDLIDQLFSSIEKRLARALLLLARYGIEGQPLRAIPRVSQEALADMADTTPARVTFYLNKFKKLGFIEYDGARPLRVHHSLLTLVLHD